MLYNFLPEVYLRLLPLYIFLSDFLSVFIFTAINSRTYKGEEGGGGGRRGVDC